MSGDQQRLAEATAAIDAALDTLASVQLDALPTPAITSLVRTVARFESRLAGVTARAVGAAERGGAIAAAGAPSATTWLADATGVNTHSAASAVSLGRAIEAAPAVAAGVADGTLGTDKARTLARALDRGVLGADDVDRLAHRAPHEPAGSFTRTVRGREARADQERLRRDERWARQRRSVTHRRRDDGSVEGRFRLDPVAGDTFVTALRAMDQRDPEDTPPNQRRTRAQRDADAFTAITRHALDDGASGEQLNVRPHVSVVVPVEALDPDLASAETADAVGVSDHGTPLSAHAVRTILCDAAVRRIVVDPEGRPLDVGRATRTWSGAQRAASAAVDGGCRGPACDRPFAWTQLHHIDWWSRGGHTDLDRGIPLCHHCHHLVHDEGWTVELDAGTRIATWTSPTGHVVMTHPCGPAASDRLGTVCAGAAPSTEAPDAPGVLARTSTGPPPRSSTDPWRPGATDPPQPDATDTLRPNGTSPLRTGTTDPSGSSATNRRPPSNSDPPHPSVMDPKRPRAKDPARSSSTDPPRPTTPVPRSARGASRSRGAARDRVEVLALDLG